MPTRELAGRTLPAAGTYTIDKAHSSVGFVARHLVVTKVRGSFTEYDATIVVADTPEQSRVDVAIQAASISTKDDGRDGHLRSGDFLDVEHKPTITFASTAVRADGDSWKVDGDLTLVGVSRPVTLDVVFGGEFTDPWGNQKLAFEASTEIDREDWGLSYNAPLAGGGVLIGKKIQIEIEVQAVRQP